MAADLLTQAADFHWPSLTTMKLLPGSSFLRDAVVQFGAGIKTRVCAVLFTSARTHERTPIALASALHPDCTGTGLVSRATWAPPGVAMHSMCQACLPTPMVADIPLPGQIREPCAVQVRLRG